jgi:hypothetical protein
MRLQLRGIAVVASCLGALGRVSDSPEGRPVVTYDAHYHTKLLESALVHATDDAFPPALLDAMATEAWGFEEEMHDPDTRSGRHGYWTALNKDGNVERATGASCAIEQAIEIMTRLDYPDPEGMHRAAPDPGRSTCSVRYPSSQSSH